MVTSRRKPQAGGPVSAARRDPLASLKLADIMTSSRPFLPLEIMAMLVDFLSAPDLILLARTSKRMREMIYDDSLWIRRLQLMGCWDEVEARQQREDARGGGTPTAKRQSTIERTLVNGKGRPQSGLLSNGPPSPQQSPNARTLPNSKFDQYDGSEANHQSSPVLGTANNVVRLENALSAVREVRSIRGRARHEFGKVYRAVGSFYNDAFASISPLECMVFKVYSSPEHQAQMLSQVLLLARSDLSPGSGARDRHLTDIVETFGTTALLEFRKGYEYKDIAGRMKQYAHVMHTLGKDQASVELFLNDNRLITQKSTLGSVGDCIDYSLGHGQLSLEKTQMYFDRLANAYTQEAAVINKAFPDPLSVQTAFLARVGHDVLAPFLLTLFNEAHTRGMSTYLRMVSGTFAQTEQFMTVYASPNNANDDYFSQQHKALSEIYEPHLDLYLAEELSAFTQKANSEIDQWDRALSEQAASTESFLMSNINRQAEKKDFMASFKKVVMMPVNMLPSFSNSLNQKTMGKALANGNTGLASDVPSRSTTPTPGNPFRSSTPRPTEAPTDELAAKAALMNTKLENIRSLFSIEVALNLVHTTKASLERVAQFMLLPPPHGDSARTQCLAMFLVLLQSVGNRHVKAGFDKAIDHLSAYNPRGANTSESSSPATTPRVAPLATFLELVNVGDLIQQMLDVFYESELVRLKISNRDDFLDPAVKEKKKFEAMLDERVAAGLGKGIDVLMDEVEFICGTTQAATDYNPFNNEIADIGPTSTARKVVELVGTHTGMLTGATEKTLLDVFTAEVGLRLFTTLTKHLKRQRISTVGALPLLSDLALYANFIATFKNPDLNSYFTALRAVGQIYLIDGKQTGDMATIIADAERYRGVFSVEEVVEFAERRSDWISGGVRAGVEKAMYGQGCVSM